MRSTRYAGLTAALAGALVMGAFGSAPRAFQKADPQAFTGTWQLNETASTNPNGPTPVEKPKPAAAAGGGAATPPPAANGSPMKPIRNSGAASMPGPPAGGSLGPQEERRTRAMLKMLQQVPVALQIAATAADVKMVYDHGAIAFAHKTNGGKEAITIAGGKAEVKTRWNGAALERDFTTEDALSVSERYTLSPDGRQLTVTVKSHSRMTRLSPAENPDIVRVYDRVGP